MMMQRINDIAGLGFFWESGIVDFGFEDGFGCVNLVQHGFCKGNGSCEGGC